MALTQTVDHFASSTQLQAPSHSWLKRSNVIPFPSTRAILQVTLPHPSNELANATNTTNATIASTTTPLRALLHSPLGVYVVGTQRVREEVRVQLDIALDDLDFTLHTLISTVPVAMIGPLQRHGAAEKNH
jgi:hypothetical protein